MRQYTSPTPVPGFLDPDDPTLFPRLTAAQIEELAERAETLSLSPGDVLFEQGQRDTSFYVVLSGAIDIIDRQPDGDHYFTQCQAGTFAADISMFTGEPTLARGVIAEQSSILALPPDALRSLVASSTELGDLLLRTMITRREWLMGQGYGYERLIGKRSSGDAFAIRELLERNLVPFSWHDIDSDDESKALLDRLGIGADECPVLVPAPATTRPPGPTWPARRPKVIPRKEHSAASSATSRGASTTSSHCQPRPLSRTAARPSKTLCTPASATPTTSTQTSTVALRRP
jgi:thioredoxin reductase (NADPH)